MNTVKERVSVKVPYKRIDLELYKAYCKVLQEADAMREKILDVYRGSAECKAFLSLYDACDFITREHHVEIRFSVERDKQVARASYIEPSFLKLLLQSRLLSDAEKRAILQRQGILLAQDAEDIKDTEEEKDEKQDVN